MDRFVGNIQFAPVHFLSPFPEQAESNDGEDNAYRVCNGSAQLQPFLSNQDVGAGNGTHEGCRDDGDPGITLIGIQVHGTGPEHQHSQGLVGPGEVSPQDGHIYLGQDAAHSDDGHSQFQTGSQGVLVDLEPVHNGVPSGTEGRISRGHRAGDDADHGDDGAQIAHQARADVVDDAAGTMVLHESFAQASGIAVEGNTGSSPDQSDDPFADHGSVEDLVAVPFTLDAAGHDRRLGGMETGNGTAGHSDEHDRPDRGSFRMHVGQGDFRDMVPFHEEHGPNAHSHEDQAESKERIQFPDELIHRQEGSTEIIDQ